MMFNNKKAKKPALFLHIQKTAGTSIVHMAQNAYGFDQVLSHGDYLKGCGNKSLDKTIDHKEQSPGFFTKKLFVSGHFGFDFARPLMKERYSFTFLRDPVERILSYYYFCKSRDPQQYEINALAQQLTLDQFLMLGLERPAVKARIWNNQAWQLANGYSSSNGKGILNFSPEEILELAIQHLDAFSYIGFTETFEEDRDHILRALGIRPPKEKVISNATPSRPKGKDLPTSTLKLLNELTHLDRELYKVAWSKKESLLSFDKPVDLGETEWSKKGFFFSRLINKILRLK